MVKIVSRIGDPFRHPSFDPCVDDLELVLYTFRVAPSVKDAEYALYRQGRRLVTLTPIGRRRRIQVPLLAKYLVTNFSTQNCVGILQYSTFDDGHIILENFSCSLSGTR